MPNGHLTLSPTWWRSQVLAVRCPPAHTSNSQWRGGIGPACRVLLGHNLVWTRRRSCVASLLPGQTAAPDHMMRLKSGGQRLYGNQQKRRSVAQTHNNRPQRQQSLRWSGLCSLANAHKHSALKEGGLFKVQNKRHSLPDLDDPFRFCPVYLN